MIKDKQTVRVIDIAVIFPILLYAAFKVGLGKPLGIAVLIIAVATLVYNGANLIQERE